MERVGQGYFCMQCDFFLWGLAGLVVGVAVYVLQTERRGNIIRVKMRKEIEMNLLCIIKNVFVCSVILVLGRGVYGVNRLI